MRPTTEQRAVVDAFLRDSSIVVEAGAGTGKTSTLVQCAAASPGNRRGVYLAYNKAIATEAGRKFPSSVECRTAHSLAYATVGRNYAHRLSGGRMPIREVAKRLRISDTLTISRGERAIKLSPHQLARMVMGGIGRFCYSADDQPGAWCVERLDGVDPDQHREVAAALVPYLLRAWADIASIDGALPFTHDCYLKLWAMGSPRIRADYLFVDEAQDLNRALAGVVERQTHLQRVYVGDACQQLYAWRGAVDAMSAVDVDERLQISQSFRFGPEVAEQANRWLSMLGASLRLRGTDAIPSKVVDYVEGTPTAILCRTNAGTIRAVMDQSKLGKRCALVGDTRSLRNLADAADRLKLGQQVDHPELAAFASWAELQDYAEHDGSDLAAFVRLVDREGADVVLATLDALVAEDAADVTVSTAHRSKGREWGHVQIGSDFKAPKRDENDKGPPPLPDRPTQMLAYVAVTRAQQVLGRGSLAFVDDYRHVWAPEQVGEVGGAS